MKAHCLFEQSGTFKNEFKKLGIEAYDYDILNNYGETDFQIDLFSEIVGGYNGEKSIFDTFAQDDVIMCFFPCIRFENQIMLSFRGQLYQMKDFSLKKKMLADIQLMKELERNYELVNMLFIICIDKGLKLIMENPFSEEHFLRRYWCFPPAYIDKDRRLKGDYYKKPTQYWFLNCEPQNNFIFEATEWNAIECKDANRFMKKEHYKDFANTKKEARSMIHPTYANRFIREQILKEGD